MQCDERHRAEGREVKRRERGEEAVMRLRMEWKYCMRRRVVTRSDGGQWPIVASFTLTARVNAAVRCNEKKETKRKKQRKEGGNERAQ